MFLTAISRSFDDQVRPALRKPSVEGCEDIPFHLKVARIVRSARVGGLSKFTGFTPQYALPF